ncbi:flagellar assembly peptidoglycan hydrolase FlgJ [Pseudorhodoferax sp. Leaf274]|uniref:flagellar assembly peptidoglycan hydrolase FlgJ n=1 Tax=Pseudorhodoferax sp. Leaf274 TaxID=1736318 RepID=UPI0007031D19|nr:flagellar assembly peptidoglycan hydrolase FlgJ [Pseudorhodoferax sp. Leaf274]KQP45037.1 glucosaminidase [Pseudorhodoferax sp. Leaf274]
MSLSPLVTNNNALAADARSLDSLKAQAGKDGAGAVKEAAKQLESLFMRELIKSMRDATMKSGLFDSPQSEISKDLLDQQLSVSMSGLPGGLSAAIERQLSRHTVSMDNTRVLPPSEDAGKVSRAGAGSGGSAKHGFVQQHQDAAERIEQQSGIPASYMIGQAAHETGWGKREIKHSDGSTSFNLFGIKAGPGWTGKVAEVTTTEYVNGEARKVKAKFRAYDSYEDSFRDYAQMITNSPRYEKVLSKTASPLAFATELKRAGYATDPDYAGKLSRVINSTLQVQRALNA